MTLIREDRTASLAGRWPVAVPRLAGAGDAGDVGGAVSARVAQLRAAGVGQGDRVLLASGRARYLPALLALAYLGTSIVLVDPGQQPAQRAAAADQARAQWLVHDAGDPGGFPPARVVSLAAEPPTSAGTGPAALPPADAVAWWRRGDAVILWSSGTTGAAKGVVKSGPALWANTIATLRAVGVHRDDLLAPWLPLTHQYGLSVALLWWLVGCTLLVTPYQRLDCAVDDVVRHRATVVDATPSTYYTLLRILERRPRLRRGLATVRMWGTGGAPLPAPVAEQFRAVLGTPLLDGYGLSEVGNVALATPDNPVGCGRPLPGVGVRVVDPDRRAVPAGHAGEIEVRSPGLMAGYLDGTTGSAEPTADGWYRTNDLGHLDQAGNLHVAGRRHAVHRLGHTLYPDHIERRAERACGRPVKVVPVPDDRRGASLIFVVSDPGGDPPRRWRERLAAELPTYEHPNRVCVVDEVPVTPTGKVDLARLSARVTSPEENHEHHRGEQADHPPSYRRNSQPGRLLRARGADR